MGKNKSFKQQREFFPSTSHTLFGGIVAAGIPITTETLFEAYSFGIFPWPHEDVSQLWFCPDQRGVLDFKELHVPRSLEKARRKSSFGFTFDLAFEEVIKECAHQVRPSQSGTWITDEILNAYCQFHDQGYAHSVECWENKELVGGLYGVYIGGVFSGESMFHKRTNASKLSLLFLIDYLSDQGLEWMDIQMVTPLLEQLGGKEIGRQEYLRWVERAHENPQLLDFRWSRNRD